MTVPYSVWSYSPPHRLAVSATKCPGIEHCRSSNKGVLFGCMIASSKYGRLCKGEYFGEDIVLDITFILNYVRYKERNEKTLSFKEIFYLQDLC